MALHWLLTCVSRWDTVSRVMPQLVNDEIVDGQWWLNVCWAGRRWCCDDGGVVLCCLSTLCVRSANYCSLATSSASITMFNFAPVKLKFTSSAICWLHWFVQLQKHFVILVSVATNLVPFTWHNQLSAFKVEEMNWNIECNFLYLWNCNSASTVAKLESNLPTTLVLHSFELS